MLQLKQYHPKLQEDFMKKYEFFMNCSSEDYFLYLVTTYRSSVGRYFRFYDRERCYEKVREDIGEYKKRVIRDVFPKHHVPKLEFLFCIEQLPNYHINMLMTRPDPILVKDKYRERLASNRTFTETKLVLEDVARKMNRFGFVRCRKNYDLDRLKQYCTKEIFENGNYECIDYENSDLVKYPNDSLNTHFEIRHCG